MARRSSAEEKGKEAFMRPNLVLGKHVDNRVRCQSNLVAEPMEAPARSFCNFLCRNLLCALILVFAIVCVLDTTLEVNGDPSSNRAHNRTRVLEQPQQLQSETFGDEPNTLTGVTTSELVRKPDTWLDDSMVVSRIRVSVTVDAMVHNNDRIHVELANGTGYMSIHDDELLTRDDMTPQQRSHTNRILQTLRASFELCDRTDCSGSSEHFRRMADFKSNSAPVSNTGVNSNSDSPVSSSAQVVSASAPASNTDVLRVMSEVSNPHVATIPDNHGPPHVAARVDRPKSMHDHEHTTAGRKFRILTSAWSRGSSPKHDMLFNLQVTVFMCALLVIASLICSMHQQPYRPHASQHGQPRQHVHQSDAGPPFVGTATLKVPPSWSLERNHLYSLRSWVADLVLWASATDLEAVRHGPIAALQIQEGARELVRELTPQQLQHGDWDPVTGQQVTGLMLLVHILARRYAPLEAENTTRSIAEFLSFRRLPSESIDSTLVRFDIFRTRAQNRAGFAINWTGLSWLLLQAIHVPAEIWDRLLAPLNGQLPQHEHELHELMERLRRVFHLREGRMHGNHTPGATGDNGAFFH